MPISDDDMTPADASVAVRDRYASLREERDNLFLDRDEARRKVWQMDRDLEFWDNEIARRTRWEREARNRLRVAWQAAAAGGMAHGAISVADAILPALPDETVELRDLKAAIRAVQATTAGRIAGVADRARLDWRRHTASFKHKIAAWNVTIVDLMIHEEFGQHLQVDQVERRPPDLRRQIQEEHLNILMQLQLERLGKQGEEQEARQQGISREACPRQVETRDAFDATAELLAELRPSGGKPGIASSSSMTASSSGMLPGPLLRPLEF